MNAVVIQGIGEVARGLSTLITSQATQRDVSDAALTYMHEAEASMLRAAFKLSCALAVYLDDKMKNDKGGENGK